MNALLRLSLLALTLALAACGKAPQTHAAPEAPPPATELAEPRKVVLAVDGMTCGACAASVTAELRKTGAVGDCEVLIVAKEARLTYDAARLQEADLLSAVTRAGYTAKVKP